MKIPVETVRTRSCATNTAPLKPTPSFTLRPFAKTSNNDLFRPYRTARVIRSHLYSSHIYKTLAHLMKVQISTPQSPEPPLLRQGLSQSYKSLDPIDTKPSLLNYNTRRPCRMACPSTNPYTVDPPQNLQQEITLSDTYRAAGLGLPNRYYTSGSIIYQSAN